MTATSAVRSPGSSASEAGSGPAVATQYDGTCSLNPHPPPPPSPPPHPPGEGGLGGAPASPRGSPAGVLQDLVGRVVPRHPISTSRHPPAPGPTHRGKGGSEARQRVREAHRRASFRISRAALCPDTPMTP